MSVEKTRNGIQKQTKRGFTAVGERQAIIFLFLLLPVGLLLLFSYYPAAKLIELSFSNWNGFSSSYDYVGLGNYKAVFQDARVLRAFANTLAHVALGVLQVFLGLYLAIVLNTNIRFRNFFRSMLFVPYVLNSIAVAFMFNFLYKVDTNPVNLFLQSVGLGRYAVHWLSESYFSNFSLAFIGMWCYTGFHIILFIGALQSIPLEQFEAADIDGANFGQKLFRIVIPSIKKIVGLNLFLALNGSLQAYYQVFVITKGGPAGATDTFVTATLSTAFDFSNFGKASAMGVVLFLIIAAVVVLQRKIVEKGRIVS
jgi:multiple sugar transport system permease protein